MTRGITDNSVVYISNLQLTSIINSNNNNIPIDDNFHVSWYTEHSSDLFNGQQWCWTTYEAINAEETIST